MESSVVLSGTDGSVLKIGAGMLAFMSGCAGVLVGGFSERRQLEMISDLARECLGY